MIIGICGKMGAGKDTVADQLEVNGWDIVRLSFAGPLKDMVNSAWGVSQADINAKPIWLRQLYQIVGTEVFRNQVHEDFWVERLVESIGDSNDLELRMNSPTKHIFITDVRFANELDWIKRIGGTTLWISRVGVNRKSTTTQRNHVSEKSIKPSMCTRSLRNDSSKESLGDRAMVALYLLNGASHAKGYNESTKIIQQDKRSPGRSVRKNKTTVHRRNK